MSNVVTRAHLAEVISKKLGFAKPDSSALVDALFEEINIGLQANNEVKISSFGTFKVKQKKERIGRNPKTQEDAIISARKVVSFYVSNKLKNLINK